MENRISKILLHVEKLPTFLQKYAKDRAIGFAVPFLRTAGIQFEQTLPNTWTARLKNRRKVQNHLKQVHAGGMVLLSAIGIANKYPEMVEGIVSTQTPCWKDERNWVRSWDMKGVMTIPFWAQIMGHYLKTRKVHLIHRLITNKNKKHLEELSKKTLKEGACNCLATACQYYLVKEKPELLTPIHQPAISIWGEADKSHIRSGTVKTSIHDYLPNAEIVYLKEAGHFLEVEEPELFTQIVMDFISNKIEKTA